MSDKTLAMRLLEGKGVDYRARRYDPTVRDAEQVAQQLNVPAERVFKTLVVVRPPTKPILAMVPSNRQLDLKKLAKSLGEKKVKMASHSQAESLTGLEVGGISPLALLNRGFFVVLDASAEAHEQIVISAGERGKQIELPVRDLVRLTGALLVAAARP